jgi:hypothetical protein
VKFAKVLDVERASRQSNKPRPNSISGNIELTIQLASALTQVFLKTAGIPFVPTRSRFMHTALKLPQTSHNPWQKPTKPINKP